MKEKSRDPISTWQPDLRPNSLAENAYEAIKAGIMDHAIVPGARISIDGIARQLDVSPTPIRESLARLESEGLVTKTPLRGYRTTHLLTPAQVDELFEFRLLIEPWAAGRAAERSTLAEIEELERELLTGNEVIPGSTGYEGYKEFTAHDHRFHLHIAKSSGNAQIQLAFERMHCHLHLFRLHFNSMVEIAANSEHRQIANAIRARDPNRAASAMEEHLHLSMSRAKSRALDISNV